MAFRKWYLGLTLSLGVGAIAIAACGGGDDNASPSGNDASIGSDTGGGDAQPSDSAPPTDAGVDASAEMAACLDLTDKICSKLAQCDSDSYYVQAACDVMRRSCPSTIFGDGSMFTVAQANACAAQIDELYCIELAPLISGSGSVPPFREFSACNVPGTRSAGDSCEFGSQCASLYCTSPESNVLTAVNGGNSASCGFCAPTYGPNDPCNVDPTPPNAGGQVCPPGTKCDAFIKKSCVPANAGDSCEGTGSCTYPALCVPNPDGGSAHQCVAPTPIGGACTSPSQCVHGAYCDTTCKALPKDGEDCTVSFPRCAGDSYCVSVDGGIAKQCVPSVPEGKPCGGPTQQCAFGLDCDDGIVGQLTCMSRQKNGEPCGTVHQKYVDGGTAPSTWTASCASGSCSTGCSYLKDGGPAGVCIGGPAGGGAGESCGVLSCTSCIGGAACTAGKCTAANVNCH